MTAPIPPEVAELFASASELADELLGDNSMEERERIAKAFLKGVNHGAWMVSASIAKDFAVNKAKK